jgi:23S rRNA pseudouridine1911/1915/1917 synthase
MHLLVPGAANRTLRQMLDAGRVRVNGEVCKIARKPLVRGDVVEIGDRTESSVSSRIHGIEVLFEDDHLLIIHKPAGLLTVATLHEHERTAYAFLRARLKQQDPRRKIFIVHRLDKFVSGLLVFAKSEQVQAGLQHQFHEHSIDRKYYAIVEGTVEREHGTIESRLAENHARRMHSTDKPEAGKRAVTHYRVLRRLSNVTALEVRLETGRKNQIRVHMSESGHPIVGDQAYGSTTDPFGRIGLHAFLLGFDHPVTGKRMHFETAPPAEFRKYLPSRLRCPAQPEGPGTAPAP